VVKEKKTFAIGDIVEVVNAPYCGYSGLTGAHGKVIQHAPFNVRGDYLVRLANGEELSYFVDELRLFYKKQ
jgi:hypothetical protein